MARTRRVIRSKKTLSPPWMLRLLTLHPVTNLNHLLVKPLRRRMISQLGVPTLHPETNLNHLLVKPIPHLGVAFKPHHAVTWQMMQYPSSLSTPLLSQHLNLLPTHLKRGCFHQRKIVPAQRRHVHLMVLSISFTIGHRKMPTRTNITASTVWTSLGRRLAQGRKGPLRNPKRQRILKRHA